MWVKLLVATVKVKGFQTLYFLYSVEVSEVRMKPVKWTQYVTLYKVLGFTLTDPVWIAGLDHYW